MIDLAVLQKALEGRYVVDRRIGAGGMATVFLARDTRHDRQVAVKVLNPELGAVLGAERFLAEIRVTANLQHPHLLPLFDSGEAQGLLFYVMPFVEGESLRALLDREKQLPIAEAVRITRAIAGALDHAHRHGVVHRDLKPENILLNDGQPLVADFGIALAVNKAGGHRITQTGLSLGTPQYMSPEQASGDRVIDARSDIYSLGAIAYEMLTGEPPHTGSSAQAIIARLMTERPQPIARSRASVPVQIQATIEKALEKLPADRFATAKEFDAALAGEIPVALTSSMTAAAAPASRGQRALVPALVVAVVALGALALWQAVRPTANVAAMPVGRFSVELPESTSSVGGSVSIDRRGELIAVLLRDERRQTNAVYVRRLDEVELQRVNGTDDATRLTLSPDGRSIAFLVGRSLRVVPLSGGSPREVAQGGDIYCCSFNWVDEGRIAYSTNRTVSVVPANGGQARVIAGRDSVARVFNYFLGDALPDAEHLVVSYYRGSDARDSTRLGILSIASGKLEDLGIVGVGARYSATGHLVWMGLNGTVNAIAFNAATRRASGESVRLAEDVPTPEVGGTVAVSANGALIHVSQPTARGLRLYAVDRRGVERQLTRSADQFAQPRVSPDGKRIVVRRHPSVDNGDLWIYDIESSSFSRLTDDSVSIRGEWTRDGSRVVFIHRVADSAIVRSRYWDRRGPDSVLARSIYESAGGINSVVPARGSDLAALRIGSSADNPNIWVGPLGDLDRRWPIEVAQTAAFEIMPSLSPDGSLVAYASNETGAFEVYVTSARERGPRLTVSTGGGTDAKWGVDGRTLYYRSPTHFVAATISSRPLALIRTDRLFLDRYSRYQWIPNWDLFPDGEHFLVMRTGDDAPRQTSRVQVLTNWPALLTRGRGTN